MSWIRPGLRQQEHGADAPSAETLDAIGQFVVDIASSHHGPSRSVMAGSRCGREFSGVHGAVD